MDSDRQQQLGDSYVHRHRSPHLSHNSHLYYGAHHPVVPYRSNNDGVVLFAASSSFHRQPLSAEEKKLQQKLKRQEKQRLVSEKTRILQKLLPCDKLKMDMGTVLEETHKYISFLRAQIAVLRSMPVRRDGSSGEAQQLLQVVLNSNVAQSMLYGNGCCVYAVEQLLDNNNNNNASSSDDAAAYDGIHRQVYYPQLS